jgi:hypothetical protein
MSSTLGELDEKVAESPVVEDVEEASLSAMYKRHGRVDLVPVPSDDPNDPLNWSS